MIRFKRWQYWVLREVLILLFALWMVREVIQGHLDVAGSVAILFVAVYVIFRSFVGIEGQS